MTISEQIAEFFAQEDRAEVIRPVVKTGSIEYQLIRFFEDDN